MSGQEVGGQQLEAVGPHWPHEQEQEQEQKPSSWSWRRWGGGGCLRPWQQGAGGRSSSQGPAFFVTLVAAKGRQGGMAAGHLVLHTAGLLSRGQVSTWMGGTGRSWSQPWCVASSCCALDWQQECWGI
jgi:hypothetical protein